jgi:hypothetical protein
MNNYRHGNGGIDLYAIARNWWNHLTPPAKFLGLSVAGVMVLLIVLAGSLVHVGGSQSASYNAGYAVGSQSGASDAMIYQTDGPPPLWNQSPAQAACAYVESQMIMDANGNVSVDLGSPWTTINTQATTNAQ